MEHPLIDFKLATTFIDMLKSPYYEFLIRNSNNNFADLITIREWVKKRQKKGKIAKGLTKVAQPKKTSIGKKKEAEVNDVSQSPNKAKSFGNLNLNYAMLPPIWAGCYSLTPQPIPF